MGRRHGGRRPRGHLRAARRPGGHGRPRARGGAGGAEDRDRRRPHYPGRVPRRVTAVQPERDLRRRRLLDRLAGEGSRHLDPSPGRRCAPDRSAAGAPAGCARRRAPAGLAWRPAGAPALHPLRRRPRHPGGAPEVAAGDQRRWSRLSRRRRSPTRSLSTPRPRSTVRRRPAMGPPERGCGRRLGSPRGRVRGPGERRTRRFR